MKRATARQQWAPVRGGPAEAEARIVAGRLEADGIDTRINGSPGFRGPGMHQEGGWAFFVRERDATRAREVLERGGEGNNLLESPDGLAREKFRVLMPLTVLGLLALVVRGLVAEIMERA